ncbi:MAG: Abi family protein [Anaerovoracaceae bacterium]
MIFNKDETKEFKTIEEQIQILNDRGLIISDVNFAYKLLNTINYYRLSAYSLTLRKNDVFYKKVTLENIYELYCFDNALRKLILSYTSNIEIAFRTYISYHHAEKFGPLGYLDKSNFKNEKYHYSFLEDLESEIIRSDDTFIHHHRTKLNNTYPFWVAIEVTTFGVLSKLFKNLKNEEKTFISKRYYGVHRQYIENWLQASVVARNIAAHGGRFYNRSLRSIPVKLDKSTQVYIENTSSFAYIFAIYKLQPTEAQRIQMRKDLKILFESFPFADKKHLGFPENWITLLEEQTTLDAFRC